MAMQNLNILKYTVAAGDCINLNINNSDVLMHLTMSVLNILLKKKKKPQQGDLGNYPDRVSNWTNSNQVPLNPLLN